jgi:hypothetical protein
LCPEYQGSFGGIFSLCRMPFIKDMSKSFSSPSAAGVKDLIIQKTTKDDKKTISIIFADFLSKEILWLFKMYMLMNNISNKENTNPKLYLIKKLEYHVMNEKISRPIIFEKAYPLSFKFLKITKVKGRLAKLKTSKIKSHKSISAIIQTALFLT